MEDFTTIDSQAKAEELFNQGRLAALHLMPLEFGGADSPLNIVYVPEPAFLQKAKFDLQIESLLEHDFRLTYSAEPAYKGKSFIPSSITIRVGGDKEFTEVIEIW